MPFHAYMFRPAYIRPRSDAVSKTAPYRRTYRFTAWLYPLLRRIVRKHMTKTEHLGRAVIAVVGPVHEQ